MLSFFLSIITYSSDKKFSNDSVISIFIQNKTKDLNSSADFVLLQEYNNCLIRNFDNYHYKNLFFSRKKIKIESFLKNDDELFKSCMVHQAQWLRANDKDKYDFIKKVFKEKNLIVPEDGISKDIIEILSSK